ARVRRHHHHGLARQRRRASVAPRTAAGELQLPARTAGCLRDGGIAEGESRAVRPGRHAMTGLSIPRAVRTYARALVVDADVVAAQVATVHGVGSVAPAA